MSLLNWLLLGLVGFVIYEVAEAKGFYRVLCVALGVSFVLIALALVTIEK